MMPPRGQGFAPRKRAVSARFATSGVMESVKVWAVPWIALNQYTSRDVPGGADVVGVALATNTVYVNAQSNGVYRHGEYFRKELSLNNTNLALWTNVVVGSAGQTDVSGSVFLPKTPEAFSYDADGNLTNDGRWSYVWDAENRLVSVQALSTVPSGAKLKLGFAYDYRGRRVQKTVSTWNSTTLSYQLSTNKLFVYDGWNLIAELSSSSSATRTYVWGSDLSGSMQGAGGVGGMLFVSDLSTINNQPSTHAVSYDGNGNVMGLVNVVDGTTSAKYEYGPFGEVIRITGAMAKANPFRFSTKYQDDETDLLYYGYRFYNANTGRWLSRDPIEERGGLNTMAILGNNCLDKWDMLGLSGKKCDGTASCIMNCRWLNLSANRITGSTYDWWLHQAGKLTFGVVPPSAPITVYWENVCAGDEWLEAVRTVNRPTPGSSGIRQTGNGGEMSVESRWFIPTTVPFLDGYGGDDAGAMSAATGSFCCCRATEWFFN
jgi:RHS repeat-associated protein